MRKKLIDKDALVAEIERLKNVFVNERDDFERGYHNSLNTISDFLDTLEVKEINPTDAFIEKMKEVFCKATCNGNPPRSTCTSLGTCKEYDNFVKFMRERIKL